MTRRMLLVLLMMVLLLVPGCGTRRRARLATARAEVTTATAVAQLPGAQPQAVSAPIPAGVVLFQDDFQDGQADRWNISSGWTVQQSGNVYVFRSEAAGGAWVPAGSSWTDYAYQVSARPIQGGLVLSFRMSQDGRYLLHVRTDGMYLVKEFPAGDFSVVTQTAAPSFNTWHQIVLAGYGGWLQVYVDGALQLDYIDTMPLLSGTVGISTLEGYVAEVDDVLVTSLMGSLPTPAPQALPATLPPPAAELPQGELPMGEETPPADSADQPAPVDEGGEAPSEAPAEVDEGPAPGDEAALPVIDYFTFDEAEDDGCYYLRWDLHDATAAYINGAGVTAPGVEEVCFDGPGSYDYTLRAENGAGSVEERLAIVVDGEAQTDGLPDVALNDYSVFVPDEDEPRTVLVHVQVANWGDVPAGAFTVRWYPHRNDPQVGCSWDVNGLVAHGGETLESCYYTYPANGDMHWRLTADADNDVEPEADQDNNVAEGSVVIQAPPEVPASPPAAPTNLRLSGSTDSTLILEWVDNSDNEDGFRVRYVGEGWEAETGADETQAEVPLPPCGQTVEYRVRAFNAAGDSPPSPTFVFQYACP